MSEKYHLAFLTLALVAGLSGAALTLWLSLVRLQWGVVDMQALLTQQAHNLARNHSGKIPPLQMQKLTRQWKQQIQKFADSRNLILVSKSAVIGDALPDYTPEILTLLNQDNLSDLPTGG